MIVVLVVLSGRSRGGGQLRRLRVLNYVMVSGLYPEPQTMFWSRGLRGDLSHLREHLHGGTCLDAQKFATPAGLRV